MLRRSRLLVIAAAFAIGLPSAASASTVHISAGNDVIFESDPGEDNVVEIEEEVGLLVVEDTVGLTAGPGCAQIDPLRASCPLAAFDGVFAYLDDGENAIDASLGDAIYVDGSQGASNEIYAYTWDGATLVGGPGPDDLDSGPGNDGLYGNGGDDKLEDGWGIDILQGGDDDDTLRPNLGNDDIQGGDGFDTVSYAFRGDPQHLSIDNAANDGQDSEADNIHTDVEQIEGGSGRDEITGSAGPDVLNAGDGNDIVRGGVGDDEINGDGGNDDLKGEFGQDTIDGGAHHDAIDGGFSADKLEGSTGNDTVNGSLGEDDVAGGPDNDTLLGGAGNDDLSGDAGQDNLEGQSGADTLAGGIGGDTVDYGAYVSPVTVDLDGSNYDDGVESEGDSVRADVEHATGGQGDDKITGNGLQNVLIGGQGNDTIDGGANQDVLIGASGADTLLSKDGAADQVDCGIDVDTFTSDAIDTLTDCEPPVQPAGNGGGEAGQNPGGGGPVAPAARPALLIGPSSARVSRSRFVKLSVSCPTAAGAACTGTLRLQRTVKGKVKTLGSKKFSVRAGAKRTLKIKVSKSTAKSVARKPLRVNAVGRTTAGASDTSRKVTLKPAARRKR